MTGVSMVGRKCSVSFQSMFLVMRPRFIRSWFSIPPLNRKIRLNMRPRAVAEMTMGKKYSVRNTWAPTRMESTSRASMRAMPTWNTTVQTVRITVLTRAVRRLGSRNSSA